MSEEGRVKVENVTRLVTPGSVMEAVRAALRGSEQGIFLEESERTDPLHA